MEQWVDKKTLYSGKVVKLHVGNVRMDDGTLALREVVEHPGGCGIVPVLDGSVILIRQYRVAIGRDVLEIPAGKLEGDEDPIERARCELEEETGYRAERVVPVGSIFASVGYTTEKTHMFLAFDLHKTSQNLEADECIEVVPVALDEIEDKIASNELKDAKTIIGLQALLAHLRKG